MTFDTELSDRLRELTDDVEGGPSLAKALQTGRTRRRTRRLAWGGGAAAAVLGLTGTGIAVLGQGDDGGGETVVAVDPPADDGSFVPTSDVDELIQEVVGRYVDYHARDVYPSDWTRKTPLPDAQAQNATDWQAYYDLPQAQELAVVLGLQVPYEDPWTGCQAGDPACQDGQLADGRTWSKTTFVSDTKRYRMASVRDDGGRVVNVWIALPTGSTEQPAISDAKLLEIASDADLTFPDPEVTPPPTPPPGVSQ